MSFGPIARFAAVATGLLMPLALGGCVAPPYRYVSGPCGPTPGWGQNAANGATPNGTSVAGPAGKGTTGKQCVYPLPDYAGGPAGSYAYAGYPYGAYGYDGFYDGFGYGYPYWLGGWAGGFGAYYGHGYYGHGFSTATPIKAAGAASTAVAVAVLPPVGSTAAAAAGGKRQKFFATFFKKEALFSPPKTNPTPPHRRSTKYC